MRARFLRYTVAISLAFLAASLACAEDDEGKLPKGLSELPPGMEIIKVGEANIVAPEGSRVYEENTVIIVEPIEQYAARRFLEVEARLKALEEKQREILKALEELATGSPPSPPDRPQRP